MPRKKKILPKEIQIIVDEVREKELQEDLEEAHAEVQKIIDEQRANKDYWDVKKDEPIEYFDPTLSYELTGYRPINEKDGLDFDPSWFTETRDNYLKTKKIMVNQEDLYNLQNIFSRPTTKGYILNEDNKEVIIIDNEKTFISNYFCRYAHLIHSLSER